MREVILCPNELDANEKHMEITVPLVFERQKQLSALMAKGHIPLMPRQTLRTEAIIQLAQEGKIPQIIVKPVDNPISFSKRPRYIREVIVCKTAKEAVEQFRLKVKLRIQLRNHQIATAMEQGEVPLTYWTIRRIEAIITLAQENLLPKVIFLHKKDNRPTESVR